jgi:hypothetical protein
MAKKTPKLPPTLIVRGPDGALYSIPTQHLAGYRLSPKGGKQIESIIASDRQPPPGKVKTLSASASDQIHSAVQDDSGQVQCCEVCSA